MKRIITSFVLLFFTFASGGCGYSTASLLPPGLDSIHVENFTNKINPAGQISDKKSSYDYRPGLEVDITNRVIDKFIIDNNLDIESGANAALTLKGALVDLQHLALSYQGDDDYTVEQYRLEIFVDLELHNNLTGKLMWKEKRFLGQTNYDVLGTDTKTESEALESAIEDLAQRIIERVIEAW